MNSKKQSRIRRARRARAKIRELRVDRLCINRTPRHIYAQIIAADGGIVIASASTLDVSTALASSASLCALPTTKEPSARTKNVSVIVPPASIPRTSTGLFKSFKFISSIFMSF